MRIRKRSGSTRGVCNRGGSRKAALRDRRRADSERAVEGWGAPDKKFEDFVAAGVRTAELVAAGARAASHVADAVLGLCRGGGDDCKPACGISGAGAGIGVNTTASISSGISLIVNLINLYKFNYVSVSC